MTKNICNVTSTNMDEKEEELRKATIATLASVVKKLSYGPVVCGVRSCISRKTAQTGINNRGK